MSILDQTGNLLSLYVHTAGRSEVPRQFHLWSGIAAIAACVGDHVWFEKFKDNKLAPNLYVCLLGPSGCGKGEAIKHSLKFIGDLPAVNMYSGRATMQAIMRRMGRPRKTDDGRMILDGSKLLLVTPELSFSVGKGDRADALIKGMTEMYTGSPYPVSDDAITREMFTVKDYCLNWIAGTTLDWLVDCLPRDAISGGFFGRMIAIAAEYDFSVRIRIPEYPYDYREVFAFVAARFAQLTRVNGRFIMDDEADSIDAQWYKDRPEPDDRSLAPAWRRQHDLILKLSMIFALADDTELVIRATHIQSAQKASGIIMKAMPELISSAHVNPETAGLPEVAKIISRLGTVRHTTLLKLMWPKGVNAERLRMATDTLAQARQIARQGENWIWIGRHVMPPSNGNGAISESDNE